VVRQLTPKARDAAQRKVNRLTVGVIAASVAGTLAIGAGIAVAAPAPKANNKTDFSKQTQDKPATKPKKAGQAQAPVNDKPESSSGDEQTTSGGS
jgi:hypothetical protein